MEVNTGDMSNFFGALDTIGFYGATHINPTDMRNNCVSVSLCRLLGYANPLSEKGIRDLCGLTGWLFKWDRFKPQPFIPPQPSLPGKPGHDGQPALSAYNVMMEKIKIRFTTLRVVLYRRADGTGHAVNAFFSHLMGEGPRILLLADWQADHMGQPVPGDLEGATEIITLDLDWGNPQAMQSLVDRYGNM